MMGRSWPERFDRFAAAPGLRERLVSMEIFNRHEDYLLRGVAAGNRSLLVECFEAGWRVGLIGVSDDHSANWGLSDGYGRTGLWVRELTRDGVREALLARRVFATRARGFRLDATANGVRMGDCLTHPGDQVRMVVDIGGGAELSGRKLCLQVLGHGPVTPRVLWAAPVVVAPEDDSPIQIDLEVRCEDTSWLVIRISDPDVVDSGAHSADLDGYGAAVACSNPFFLRPSPFDSGASVGASTRYRPALRVS